MKVILLEDVKSLGKKGDVVNVSDGYARNMLLPRKKAMESTPQNMNTLKLMKKHEDKVAQENLDAAKALAGDLGKGTIKLSMKVGENGRTFGAVAAREIADAVKSQMNLDIDKKKIQLSGPIKDLGSYEVGVKLHPQVTAKLKVEVEKA